MLERIKKQKQEEGKDDSLIRQQVLDVAESEEENVAVRFLLLDNIASFWLSELCGCLWKL